MASSFREAIRVYDVFMCVYWRVCGAACPLHLPVSLGGWTGGRPLKARAMDITREGEKGPPMRSTAVGGAISQSGWTLQVTLTGRISTAPRQSKELSILAIPRSRGSVMPRVRCTAIGIQRIRRSRYEKKALAQGLSHPHVLASGGEEAVGRARKAGESSTPGIPCPVRPPPLLHHHRIHTYICHWQRDTELVQRRGCGWQLAKAHRKGVADVEGRGEACFSAVRARTQLRRAVKGRSS